MGSLRRGIILGLIPIQAAAEVCDKERPLLEQGTQGSALSEALHLFLSPIGIFAAILFLIAIAVRRPWLLWASFAVSAMLFLSLIINPAFPDPTGFRYFAVMEGCIGSQNLSLAITGLLTVTTFILARRNKTTKAR